ncbi:MAG: tetratricopeptide repeat protein, partial [Actinomycetota bacterium]|nr:tetratricopeptide repeat protein [Actinomycetota bacterium]
MKVLPRRALPIAALASCVALAAAPSAALAQRAPDPNAKRLLVPVFRSADKTLGVQAADAVRGRVTQDLGSRDVYVLSKDDINKTLEASGFPTTDPLAPNDARELGRQLRANEYLEGTVTKTAAGVRIEPRLVLVRDNSYSQPLPAAEGAKVGDAAKAISNSLRDARKQIKFEEDCNINYRQKKYAEAIAAAKKGVQAYPRATIARTCLLNVYREMPMDSVARRDSVLKLSNEVLAIDARNVQALTTVAQTYEAQGNDQKAVEAYTALVAADPTNVRIVERATRAIARSGNPGVALPIIRQAVAANAGDPQLLRLQFLIELAAKDFKAAPRTGEQLVQLDTAFADSSYFVRIAGAYVADSQPQKASETLARGLQKFPNNSTLLVSYANTLRSAGQNQQAVDVLRRALQANPRTAGAYLELARAQVELKQNDEAVTSLRTALTSGDTPETVAPYALQVGNQLYRAANTTKTPEDYSAALRVLQFADSLSPANGATKAQGQFLIGVTALSLGQTQLKEAQAKKS